MKKVFLCMIVILLMMGCQFNQVTNVDDKQSLKKQEQTAKNDYVSNPQVTDDTYLIKVGDRYQDEKGEALLKGIKQINEVYQLGPIELTIHEAKVIHLIPDYSLMDYYHVLTHEPEFDFVKVFVEIKNNSSEPVHFSPIALFETSTGEVFDWEKDIYLENLNGEIKGNEKKVGNIGFILEKSSKDLKWIKILTSKVVDDKKNSMHEEMELKFPLSSK